jgi:hypothetical protein
MQDGYMKKKAKSALAPWRDKEDEEPSYKFTGDGKYKEEEDEDEGTDEPANVSGLAEKKKKEKDSGWGKKVAAAIAGTIGAVAGANLQHKQNQRKEKAYQAKRKTGNYL